MKGLKDEGENRWKLVVPPPTLIFPNNPGEKGGGEINYRKLGPNIPGIPPTQRTMKEKVQNDPSLAHNSTLIDCPEGGIIEAEG